MGRHRKRRGRHADPYRHRGPDCGELRGWLVATTIALAALIGFVIVGSLTWGD